MSGICGIPLTVRPADTLGMVHAELIHRRLAPAAQRRPQPGERLSCANCGADVLIRRDLHFRHSAQCRTCMAFEPVPLR